MKVYLVGGAVRDRLLNIQNSDRDWLVVGSSPEEMLSRGYQAVGQHFPVFLHPETHEEYALARTERKSGRGYTGFECYYEKSVTLEDDLKRRDLTINAMAYDVETQRLIDPYGGEPDLEARILRHVSPAFIEDPLRVLRVARFAASLKQFGFRVHPDTLSLMQRISLSGELNTLSPERVWQELQNALMSQSPQSFLKTLRRCGALLKLFPEIDALYGVPANIYFHPEIDTGIHLELVLAAVVKLSDDIAVRFAVLMHDLGKGLTPRQKWPDHQGHAERGVALVRQFSEKWRVPKKITELAMKVCEHHTEMHQILDYPTPERVLNLLEKLNAFRNVDALSQFCLACEADHAGRLNHQEAPYPQKDFLMGAYDRSLQVDMPAILEKNQKGADIKSAIHHARYLLLKSWIDSLH